MSKFLFIFTQENRTERKIFPDSRYRAPNLLFRDENFFNMIEFRRKFKIYMKKIFMKNPEFSRKIATSHDKLRILKKKHDFLRYQSFYGRKKS